MSNDFQQALSITGSANGTLIDSEDGYPPAGGIHPRTGNRDGWSENLTKSWHTRSTGAPSADSRLNPNHYGNPSAPSVTGTGRTFDSGLTERSALPEIRSNGWVRTSAVPRSSPSASTPTAPMVSCSNRQA